MAMQIRPYVSIAESIMRTAPNLMSSTMDSVIVGPAVEEKTGFLPELNFTALNNVDAKALMAVDENGSIFDVAGIRPGTTVEPNSFSFGAYTATTILDFGDKELHVHVKSKDEKYILVLEKDSDGKYVTEQDLLDKGLMIGDTITINPPTEDDKPFSSQIRDFDRDSDNNLLIYIWDEVPYDVDDSDSLTGYLTKSFKDAALESVGFTFESAPNFPEKIYIKGKGIFYFTYFN